MTNWQERAQAAETALREARDGFKKHTEVVEQFLSDLYATMIDPCADGTIPVTEMQKLLLAAARNNRQGLYDAQTELQSVLCDLREAEHDVEQVRELLRRLAESLPPAKTLEDLHSDDPKHARKYPVTLTDNFMMEIWAVLSPSPEMTK